MIFKFFQGLHPIIFTLLNFMKMSAWASHDYEAIRLSLASLADILCWIVQNYPFPGGLG